MLKLTRAMLLQMHTPTKHLSDIVFIRGVNVAGDRLARKERVWQFGRGVRGALRASNPEAKCGAASAAGVVRESSVLLKHAISQHTLHAGIEATRA